MLKTIGVDIGGTKIAAGICTESGELLGKIEIPSNTSNRETMFQSVTQAIELTLKKNDVSLSEINGIGVGVPGKVDCASGIAVFQNNLPWRNFPIVDRLREEYAKDQIVIDNDVYMAAYAEYLNSGIDESQTFTYITISTGIASSTMMNGAFVRGAGFAGEVGLLPVSAPLKDGYTVERLEFTSSGPNLQRVAAEYLGNRELTTKDLFMEYQKEDPKAMTVLKAAAQSIAHGVYAINCLLDPHRIHFGGSVMVHNPFFLNLIREKLAELLISDQRHILQNLYISPLGQDNGVLGAGMRVFRQSTRSIKRQ